MTADELRKKYERDLADLQASCPHDDLSPWTEQHWAPGHRSGYSVRYCNTCHVDVHKSTYCSACAAIIVDDEIVKGDGKKTAWGSPYCKACAELGDKAVMDIMRSSDRLRTQREEALTELVHQAEDMGMYDDPPAKR